MFHQSNSSRTTLLSVARTLLQTADDAHAIPELAPYLASADAALLRFQVYHTAAVTTSDRMSAQVLSAQQAEEVADRRVSAFAGRLAAEAKGGDLLAEAAMRRLFPAGVSRLVHYTGRAQLTQYQIFRARLSETTLPAILAQEPIQIFATLDDFAAALSLKEQRKIQLRTAQRDARLAERTLKEALSNLEKISSIYLSADQMRVWSEPARALGRSSSLQAQQKLAA